MWKWNSTFCIFTTYEHTNRANNYRNCSAFPFLKVRTLLARTEHISNIVANELCMFVFRLPISWLKWCSNSCIFCSMTERIYVCVINSILRWNSVVSSFDGFRGQKQMCFCAQARNHKPKTAKLKAWQLKFVLHSIDVGILFYFQNSIPKAVRFLPLFECKIIFKLS